MSFNDAYGSDPEAVFEMLKTVGRDDSIDQPAKNELNNISSSSQTVQSPGNNNDSLIPTSEVSMMTNGDERGIFTFFNYHNHLLILNYIIKIEEQTGNISSCIEPSFKTATPGLSDTIGKGYSQFIMFITYQ